MSAKWRTDANEIAANAVADLERRYQVDSAYPTRSAGASAADI
jgi:hypothetical protein